MGGKNKLVGKTALRAEAMLNDVTAILEKNNVDYVLEGGTLLGIVREDRLLPWDDDLDLTITSSQLSACKSTFRALFMKGYRVRERKQEADDFPLTKGSVRCIKIFNRKWFFFKGDIQLDVFVKYRHEDQFYWSVGKGARYTKKSVLAKFYLNLDSLMFRSKAYSVPKDYKTYLSVRYGDWQAQVKTWDYSQDDKAKCDKN